jgi:hypothetical protein
MEQMSALKLSLAAAALLVASTAVSTGADAKGARTRFECRANGAIDISMSARYETRTGPVRRIFSTEFEAGPRTGFKAGKKLGVAVDGINVGSMRLEAIVGGDIVGDLNFDTRRQLDALPFPSNWPDDVGRNTTVEILRGTTILLGCSLR